MPAVLDKFFGVHEQALHVWSRRSEILASNIANADTPNYKAKDLDFNQALNQATNRHAVAMQATHANHHGMHKPNNVHITTQYRIPLQSSLDGNTVDSQIEHSKFSENAVRQQVSLHFLGNRIKGLIKTLREE